MCLKGAAMSSACGIFVRALVFNYSSQCSWLPLPGDMDIRGNENLYMLALNLNFNAKDPLPKTVSSGLILFVGRTESALPSA